MDRAVSPNNIVWHDGLHVLWALRQAPSDRVQYETSMEIRDECDVNVQARRILNLGHRKAVHLFALLFAEEITLENLFPIRRVYKKHSQAAEASASARTVGKDAPANASRKNAPHDERCAGPHTRVV